MYSLERRRKRVMCVRKSIGRWDGRERDKGAMMNGNKGLRKRVF